MKKHIFTLAAVALAPAAHALDLQALKQQVMANPAVQQQVAGAVMANPQLASNVAAGAMASFTPQQTQQLATQIQAISQQVFNKAEQKKLSAFQATPEGASIMAKLPQVAQQLAPVLLQMYLSQSTGAAPAAAK